MFLGMVDWSDVDMEDLKEIQRFRRRSDERLSKQKKLHRYKADHGDRCA